MDTDEINRVLADPDAVFLDVREPAEIASQGTLEGYVNIPLGQLEARLSELPRDRPILTACNGGGRAARAAAILVRHGFQSSGACALRHYKGERIHPDQGPSSSGSS